MIDSLKIPSVCLHTDVKIDIILPQNDLKNQQIEKVLILLHGKKECDKDETILDKMVRQLKLEVLCDKYHWMIVLPCMKNCYYISSELYDCEKFIGEELVTFLTKYHKDVRSAEKILGGVSMGGYGAMLMGANLAKNGQKFHKIISISGSFIEEDIKMGNPQVWGGRLPTKKSTQGSFLYYFLPLNELSFDSKKSVTAALKSLYGVERKPEFYLSCGTKDWLYARNLRMLDTLKENKIPFAFYEKKDETHNSDCFNKALWEIVDKISK